MAEDRMLQEAIEAVAAGQSERARDLLTRLLRANQSNPRYWLWMSSAVDTTKERLYCLQKVLQLDPLNRAARLGMVLGGISSPDEGLQPLPIPPRNWKETYKVKSLDSGPKKYVRGFAYFGAFILVFGLIGIGLLAPRMNSSGYFGGTQLTVTPIFETLEATATLLPTNTPRVVTPTPTFIGPTPLWMLLEATYTPTPLYVNTPHPVTEAYRAGIRAFTEGNYEEMLMFMQQATRAESRSADIYYYIGEANLLLKKPDEALFAFEKSIETNPNFAPAYFGRAKAMLALDPEFDIESDLNQAVVLDPSMASAHLELIAYYLVIGNFEFALDSLEIAEKLVPESPLIYAYRSQALLQSGEFEMALEAAQQAYELDQTILEVYQTLGNLHLLSGNSDQASHFLEIYLRYVTDDANTWAAYGRALFESGDRFDEAMHAFDLALVLDENSFTALLFRGLSYLESGQGQLAVNDLFIARNFDRESFVASLGLARALSLAERYNDAVSQFTGSELLASTESQRAEVYYWRADTFRLIGDKISALNDFETLLTIEDETIPEIWLNEAQQFILEMTPTPTMTSSPLPATLTPTVATPTFTPTSTPSPTIPSPTPTITQTPTATDIPPSPTATSQAPSPRD
jgi:tetratricopeptide (TPR) repeat protein